MSKPSAYICLWEYVPPEQPQSKGKLWKLVECYGVDDSGYACTESIHATKGRCSYQEWMNRKAWYGPDKELQYAPPSPDQAEDYDWEPIMGRAVTIWTTEGGSRMADFHPPEWVPWLSSQFFEKLGERQDWFVGLENGFILYAGTARAVEKMIGIT